MKDALKVIGSFIFCVVGLAASLIITYYVHELCHRMRGG